MRYVDFLSALACLSIVTMSVKAVSYDKGKTDSSTGEYVIENGKLYSISKADRSEIPLPAPGTAIHAQGNELYVALGSQGVVIFSLSETPPKIAKRIPATDGRVIGFFEVDGRVWMQLESTTAKPVDQSFTSSPELTKSQKSVVQQSEIDIDGKKDHDINTIAIKTPIHIATVSLGEATLNVGAQDGVKESDKFTVFREHVIENRGQQNFRGKKQVGVLEVVAVNKETSLTKLSRGDRVQPGDEVRHYENKNRQYRIYPRRLEKLGEASVVLRPLLNVNGKGKGFGGLCDATVSWWGKYYFLNFRTQPVAFGWTENGDIVSSSILGEAGYDGRAFAVGIGAGVGVVNGDMDTMISNDYFEDSEDGAAHKKSKTRAAFALSQTVRLGARDGLNLVVYNQFLYYNDKNAPTKKEDDSGFIYGGTSGRFNIPLGNSIDLFLGGGGGRMGYGFGEVGIFAWIVGNGDGGSWGLSAAAGGAGVWTEKRIDEYSTERIAIAGPLISLGVTHRFGVGKQSPL